MKNLNSEERSELIRLIQSEEHLPPYWRTRLFSAGSESVEIGKEYRLEYAGKMKREQVLAETPAGHVRQGGVRRIFHRVTSSVIVKPLRPAAT